MIFVARMESVRARARGLILRVGPAQTRVSERAHPIVYRQVQLRSLVYGDVTTHWVPVRPPQQHILSRLCV